MNREALAVGLVSFVGSIVLLILERTTPKNERVLTQIWFSHSHESVRILVVLMAVPGLFLIALGLILP